MTGTVALAALGLPVVAWLSPATQYVWGEAPRIGMAWFQTYDWSLLILFSIALGFMVYRRRKAGRRGGWQPADSGPLHDGSPKASDFPIPPTSRGAPGSKFILLISYGVLFCGFFYTGLYYESTYQGYFLQEHDFLNIAAGLSDSVFLRTPYVNTGPTGSFLGHHWSPFLILIRALFWLSEFLPRANHGIFLLPLFLGACAGQLLWFELARQRLSANYTGLLPLLALVLILHPGILRLNLSLHFEIFVLPLSALAILLWRRRSYWVALILLFSVKEDVALYCAFAFASLWWWSPEQERGRLKNSFVVASLYFVLAVGLRHYLAGSTGVNWLHYWSEAFQFQGKQLHGLLFILLSGAWLAFLDRRWLLPILLTVGTHLISRHPWHNSFQSHYVYTTLPMILILLGQILPASQSTDLNARQKHEDRDEQDDRDSQEDRDSPDDRGAQAQQNHQKEHPGPEARAQKNRLWLSSALSTGVGGPGILGLALVALCISMVLDRSSPLPFFASRKPDIGPITSIPAGSCVRSSRHISVRLPLNSRPLPIYPIAGNPVSNDTLCFPPPQADCKNRYLLLESQDTHLLHGCRADDLRFVTASKDLSLFEYGSPTTGNTHH